MKRYLLIGKILFLICMSFILLRIAPSATADAKEKKYGIAIADENGKYTFYDLNDKTDGKASIEVSPKGNVMIPLKKLTSYMPLLSYKFNSVSNTATITNTQNGKKIVLTKDSKYLNYYSGPKAKPSKKSMVYKMYISESSSDVMVHMSTLKWVCQSSAGVKSFKTVDMQKAGYDTLTYSSIILYNPYEAITELPKASKVTGISATVKVTIPEGYSVAQIFDLLVKKGVCASTEGLYQMMEDYDFSYYPLVSEIPDNENRCFKLEGYLYPDTYEFYRLSKPQDVIGKFLRNTEAKLTAEDRAKAVEMGLTVNEILTIASMIEKETADKNLMSTIASVIYNRLDLGMKLQFDSTIYYVERYIKPFIIGDINRYNSFYNTYKCPALPASPICNPGRAAIKAALNPETTDYLYFYSDEAGEYHFSKDYVKPAATE